MSLDTEKLKSVRLKPVLSCPLCQANAADPFADGEIPAVRCRSCGLIYMSSVVEAEDLERLYRGYNDGRDTKEAALAAKRKIMYEKDYSYVHPFIRVDDLRILDIGCGGGGFLSRFDRHLEKYGIEIDAAAPSKELADIEVYSSLAAVPSGKLFDIVIFRGTLQYQVDLLKIRMFLDQRLASHGRIFILAAPNADSLLCNLQREHWALFNAIEHRYCFGLEQIRRLLPGYRVLDYDMPYLGTPYENYQGDLVKVLRMIDDEAARTERVPFFGSIINIILEKITD
jgi:SAM-dependent methyltransferase